MSELENQSMNMKFDETELIEFFGVLPTKQDPDEQEFFGTTIFDYSQDNLHLSISYSVHYNDFSLFLNLADLEKPLFQTYFKNVHEIKIQKDKPNSTPVLLIMKADENNENVLQTIEITMEPNINIKLNN